MIENCFGRCKSNCDDGNGDDNDYNDDDNNDGSAFKLRC